MKLKVSCLIDCMKSFGNEIFIEDDERASQNKQNSDHSNLQGVSEDNARKN